MRKAVWHIDEVRGIRPGVQIGVDDVDLVLARLLGRSPTFITVTGIPVVPSFQKEAAMTQAEGRAGEHGTSDDLSAGASTDPDDDHNLEERLAAAPKTAKAVDEFLDDPSLGEYRYR